MNMIKLSMPAKIGLAAILAAGITTGSVSAANTLRNREGNTAGEPKLECIINGDCPAFKCLKEGLGDCLQPMYRNMERLRWTLNSDEDPEQNMHMWENQYMWNQAEGCEAPCCPENRYEWNNQYRWNLMENPSAPYGELNQNEWNNQNRLNNP